MELNKERVEYIEDVSRRAFTEMQLRKEHTTAEEGRCYKIDARCHVSGRLLFGRKCVKVKCFPGAHLGYFHFYSYFEPKQYVLWVLKK